MSYWTYVNGTVIVSPMGRTQPEKRYILDTVLDHLPRVTGSERDMNVYVIQKAGFNSHQTHDEFGERTNNLTNSYGFKSRDDGWLDVQQDYILVCNGALRDREFDETYKEFLKWITRLAKRIRVEDVFVKVVGCNHSAIIRETDQYAFGEMFEIPSWSKSNTTGEPNWTEFMMWESAKNSPYPMMLGYKYFADEENDKEVERRIAYMKGE